jgi:N-methylhydantoinase A/oxoprolinase/acetone carboxylase beta subunit
MKGDGSPLLLGIDTGGTFTDSVLLDVSQNKIISKSKAPTTHRNLTLGIRESIEGLGTRDFGRVTMVGLSTTLATNAIVERTGRPVGLIVVGYDGEIKVPISGVRLIRISGGHNVRGEETAPLDKSEVKRFVKGVEGGVEAFACASYFSVRNPDHEDRVEKIVSEITKKPIVLGHRLSMDLDLGIRAVTCALNAGLIPLISELLSSVKGAMSKMGIKSPLMMVKGDGSLMTEETAQKRPIETILSGPAASVVGAKILSKLNSPNHNRRPKDTVVIDIGGTTTDIALLTNSLPHISSRGAVVGGFRTFVNAVGVRTVGLGGDSIIDYDSGGEISVGPRRVMPLCRLAERYPKIIEKLEREASQPKIGGRFPPTDFFVATPLFGDDGLSEDETELIESISVTPISEADFGEGKEKFKTERAIDRMMGKGLLFRAGLTPTDVFNTEGLSEVGSIEASEIAIDTAAAKIGVSKQELLEMVGDKIRERLVFEIISTALKGDGDGSFRDYGILSGAVLDWLSGERRRDISLNIRLDSEIIAVGAPAHVFIGPAADRLNSRYSIPNEAPVAGAVGAVSGVILSTKEAIIRPDPKGGYILFAPSERKVFKDLDEAKGYAKTLLEGSARDEVSSSGGIDVEVTGGWRDTWAGEDESKIFIETKLKISAVGRPEVGRGD